MNELNNGVNPLDSEMDRGQNLNVDLNTDSKANFIYSHIQNIKLKKNSELMKKEEDSSVENSIEINYNASNTRKNSDIFSNKICNDIFNLDNCNFENAEDMMNFDCFDCFSSSNGIFSNKEITFDENYNSNDGEEHQDKIMNPAAVDHKASAIDLINKDYSINKLFFIKENEEISNNNNKSIEIIKIRHNNNNNNEEKITEGGSLLFLSKSKNNSSNGKTIKDSNYKIINEEPFYEKKNMSTLKKFFNQTKKNDNNTIKSIDDSTTVSTQFTKEKNNSTKNSQKSQMIYNKNNTNLNKISEVQVPTKVNKDKINYFLDSAHSNSYNSNTRTENNDNDNNNNNNNKKNFLLEKDEIFPHTKTTSGEISKSYSVNSGKTPTPSKCGNTNNSGNNKRVHYIDNNSNYFFNTNSSDFDIRSSTYNNQNKLNYYDNHKIQNSEIMSSNVSNNNNNNLNCSSSTSKEKNLNIFCIQNDFKKSFAGDKGDSESNKIFKNLLATAKYFDLDG